MGLFSLKSMKEREEATEKRWPTIRSVRFKKYSEGYEFYQIPRGNGRSGTRTVSVYVGDYYSVPLSSSQWYGLRALYALLLLGSAALFLFCGTRRISFNLTWYAAILELPTIFLYLYLLVVLFYYTIAPKKMTVYDYRTTSLRLQKFCLFLMAILLADTAAAVLHMCFNGFAEASSTLLSAGGFLISAVLIDVINRVEKTLPYEKEKSQDKAPENGKKVIC